MLRVINEQCLFIHVILCYCEICVCVFLVPVCDYLFLVFSSVRLTSLCWNFPSSNFCMAVFIDRYCLLFHKNNRFHCQRDLFYSSWKPYTFYLDLSMIMFCSEKEQNDSRNIWLCGCKACFWTVISVGQCWCFKVSGWIIMSSMYANTFTWKVVWKSPWMCPELHQKNSIFV